MNKMAMNWPLHVRRQDTTAQKNRLSSAPHQKFDFFMAAPTPSLPAPPEVGLALIESVEPAGSSIVRFYEIPGKI
jgi:hypothetical protein